MMRQLLLSSLKRRKAASLLFIGACALILIMMPLSFTSLQQVHTQVETDITHYARGSYDLLVRPVGSQHELEEQLGIVPENYLGVGEGGISVEQWETIKHMPDIEIAAPVASLGYFTGIRTNIGVLPIPEESTRYTLQFYTTDGLNRYPVSNEYVGILVESDRFGGKFESLINDVELLNEFTHRAPMFHFPPTYHLLVGIDPEEEQALTGIDFERIIEGSGASGWGSMGSGPFPNAAVIPVLERTGGTVPLQADITVDTLNIGPDEVQAFRDRLGLDDELKPDEVQNYHFMNRLETDEYDQLMEELIARPEVERKTISADLKEHLHPYESESLVVNDNGKVDIMKPDGEWIGLIDLTLSSIYYTAGHVQYKENGGKLKVKQVGEENGVPTYREINQKGIPATEAIEEGKEEEVTLIVDPVGEFEVGDKEAQLAASPLGIYKLEPVMYIGDGEEQAFPMQATITPGSFVPAPASGVTNIQAAAAVKGDTPIDAIRVKVAGISGYTSQAADKIDKIAQEIEAMGLHVTVVAGASHQFVDVEVEGVGLVQEAWTTLGAAGSIISQWNVTNIILAVFFLLVTLTYIYNRVLFWYVHQQGDIALLRRLGWESKHVLRLITSETGGLTVLAWVLALGGLALLQIWLNVSNVVYLWQVGLTVAAVALLGYMMHRKIRRLHGSDNTPGSNNARDQAVSTRHRRSGKSLTGKNIAFFRQHIRPPFIQLAVVSALSSFVYLSLTETVQLTNLTVLGEYINMQASEWHFLLIISAYVLALCTLLESLTSLLMSRQREIGLFRSLGWERSHIFKLYLKETAIWTGIAVCIGSVVSFGGYALLYPLNPEAWLVAAGSFIGLYVCTIFASALILHHLLAKELGDTLSLKRGRAIRLGREPSISE